LIQAKDGDDETFQNTAHFLAAVRGIWNSLLFLVLGGPLSVLFGIPRAAWVFQCLALVPLATGFSHLDLIRRHRELQFGPFIRVELGSNTVALLFAIPLALWLRDYSAMLWILNIQAISYCVASHLVAERSYRWAWRRDYMKRMFSFGWPLLVNGLLMF